MATLTEAIKTVINSLVPEIHTCIPGKVSKYDHTLQKAEIKPLIKYAFEGNSYSEYPVIVNVPVMMPRSKNFYMHFPISKDDTGLLIFSESALENWLSLGGIQEPGDKRKFDLSDGVFIPGLYPFSNSSPSSNNEDVEIQYKNTGVRIKNNGDIEIGGSNFKKLVNEEFKTMFDNHRHNYMGFVGTGTPTPGFTTAPTFTSGTLPPPVPTGPTGTTLPGIELSDNELTDKVTAE